MIGSTSVLSNISAHFLLKLSRKRICAKQQNLIISSKKTGEDLTAQQWQQKLQKEQDNIQLLARSMATLAKCALKAA